MDQYVGQDIEIVDVGMRYDGSEEFSVSDINVHIKPGEFFSFLGPSGCGKTTILRLVSGFLEPTEGEVRIGTVRGTSYNPSVKHKECIFNKLIKSIR